MVDYIKREAIGKAYMDLCLAKSKLAKSRKGATFFQSDLLPETEPTTKELFRLVMAMPAADVAPVRHGRWMYEERENSLLFWIHCSVCGWKSLDQSVSLAYHYCPNCGTKMDGGEKND